MLNVRRAKWILVVASLVMAFCLVQRSLNLPSFSAVPVVNVADSETTTAKAGPTPCELSSKSLHTVGPLIDQLQPFLIFVLAVIALICRLISSEIKAEITFPPPPRRHLTFCVFRE